ncbi:MAG: hypothetical protein RLN96_03960 [Pseudomonadales bacterium]
MSDNEIIDPERTRDLERAWQLIEAASNAEKEVLFKPLIESFKAHETRFEKPDNIFDSYESHAEMAMDTLINCMRRLIGHDVSWVQDNYLKFCSYGKGPRPIYDYETREVNCIFIALMVARGSSETQAMKMLIRLQGNKLITEGRLREVQNTYRHFKKQGRPTDHDLSIIKITAKIGYFLEFDISNLEGEEKASEKAVIAFRKFFQEIIDLMKTHHDLVADNDKSYPELFGCVIDWVKADYSDPLDYFYRHTSHSTVHFRERRRELTNYLNSVIYFTKSGQ